MPQAIRYFQGQDYPQKELVILDDGAERVADWNRRSFLYYEAGNPYRERFARSYGIRAKFRIVQERTDHSLDGPRLTIWLEAVKP